MTYREAEYFLLSLNNLSHEAPGPTKQARLHFFLRLLDSPEKKIPRYIHITGANGKGSVAMMLAGCAAKQRLKTGLFLSPHHSSILERWQINGTPMNRKTFVKIINHFKPKLEEYLERAPFPMLSPSELMTAIGLYYFAEQKVRLMVVDINDEAKTMMALLPSKHLTIITLKNDRKTPSHRPTIRPTPHGLLFSYQNRSYRLPIIGEHQVKNAIRTITTARALGFSERAIAHGLRIVRLPIRLEIISLHPLIVLDGAHSPDTMATTIDGIKRFKPGARVHLIAGFDANEDAPSMIRQLCTLPLTSVMATRFTNLQLYPKAANPADLARLFRKLHRGLPIQPILDPKAALTVSQRYSRPGDILLVTGSMFLAGEIRSLF